MKILAAALLSSRALALVGIRGAGWRKKLPLRLLYSALPSKRVPTRVHNRQNDNKFQFNAIENSEREPVHQSSANITVNDWKSKWLMLNGANSGKYFFKKLVFQSLLLRLIPESGISQVHFRFFAEPDLVTHSFLRISEMTLSAGRPGSLVTSYASSLLSNSAFCADEREMEF